MVTLIRQSFLILQLLIFTLIPCSHTTPDSSPNVSDSSEVVDHNLTPIQIILKNGYDVKDHHPTTDDGYILELLQITKSRNGSTAYRNYPVLIQHGILGSSADWVIAGADRSLPMLLADDGYDVWISNSRGNTYCKTHATLKRHKNKFWDFSIHELGTYDLPAVIDFIKTTSKKEKLHYIGFSMGTSIFYIMASERPEYQQYIRSQISLAPVAYLSHSKSLAIRFTALARTLDFIYQLMAHGRFMPQSKVKEFFLKTICKKITLKALCLKRFIYALLGKSPINFDVELIPEIIRHYPTGSSSKLLVHFAQLKIFDKFCQFDYGKKNNKKRYGSKKPPCYNLNLVNVPIWLFYGNKDTVANEEDVKRLEKELPQVVNVIKIDVNGYFNHVDFMWSTNVTEMVNNPIKEILETTDDVNWIYSGPDPSVPKKVSNVDKSEVNEESNDEEIELSTAEIDEIQL